MRKTYHSATKRQVKRGHQSAFDAATQCPSWVKLRSPSAQSGGPLCPQERTWWAGSVRSEKCQ